MNLTSFLVIFAILAVVTPLVTEGIKKFMESIKVNYYSNVVVLIVSVVLGAALSIFYYLQQGIDFNAINIFYIIFVILANWLGSMLGYDKVKQAILQIKSEKEGE